MAVIKDTVIEKRFFANQLMDFTFGNSENFFIDQSQVKFTPDFRKKLQKNVIKFQNILNENVTSALSVGNKVYTGTAGIAMLYLLKLTPEGKKMIITPAVIQAKDHVLKLAEKKELARDRISFLNGDCGILALAAVINVIDGHKEKSVEIAEKMIEYSKFSSSKESDIPNELLYGRSGYLHALLFVRRYIKEAIPDNVIKSVVKAIITSGKKLSTTRGNKFMRNPPLQFEWHEKEYVGAAHGYCGILYTLLISYQEGLLSDDHLKKYVQPTIDYILNLQYPSKNLPSSVMSRNYDVLVQWCHGAPGATHLVTLAYQVFKDQKYLDAALEFGEVTWERGLLTKGFNLCHGVAGNAYTFLKLYQVTKDMKHLHRATKFAEFVFNHGTKMATSSDKPYSLFEGVSGVIYFLVDLLDPDNAKFPGVELP